MSTQSVFSNAVDAARDAIVEATAFYIDRFHPGARTARLGIVAAIRDNDSASYAKARIALRDLGNAHDTVVNSLRGMARAFDEVVKERDDYKTKWEVQFAKVGQLNANATEWAVWSEDLKAKLATSEARAKELSDALDVACSDLAKLAKVETPAAQGEFKVDDRVRTHSDVIPKAYAAKTGTVQKVERALHGDIARVLLDGDAYAIWFRMAQLSYVPPADVPKPLLDDARNFNVGTRVVVRSGSDDVPGAVVAQSFGQRRVAFDHVDRFGNRDGWFDIGGLQHEPKVPRRDAQTEEDTRRILAEEQQARKHKAVAYIADVIMAARRGEPLHGAAVSRLHLERALRTLIE